MFLDLNETEWAVFQLALGKYIDDRERYALNTLRDVGTLRSELSIDVPLIKEAVALRERLHAPTRVRINESEWAILSVALGKFIDAAEVPFNGAAQTLKYKLRATGAVKPTWGKTPLVNELSETIVNSIESRSRTSPANGDEPTYTHELTNSTAFDN